MSIGLALNLGPAAEAAFVFSFGPNVEFGLGPALVSNPDPTLGHRPSFAFNPTSVTRDPELFLSPPGLPEAVQFVVAARGSFSSNGYQFYERCGLPSAASTS
ncbi:hypothetical protein EVAR_102617_1 [Eumeta japonica]|uniref:Uncharacterized protein n=1 Tax=Eumeta variegata TaxID=151549 RepID=A0A4C1TV42_EUMVA|nr:hypothetical protein EVAR_102617_1 [Eumeta japonica]